MDVLMAFHLVFYPIITGFLMMAFGINLYHGNRWVLLSGPAFTAMAVLTTITHINYQGYLA